MLRGFRDFCMRGNVVDLAVGIIVGTAFGAVVSSLVDDLIMPIIAALGGKPDFSQFLFTLNGAEFRYGAFLSTIITFVLIAAVIYFLIVVPLNRLAELRERGQAPAEATTKQCPECLSTIPRAARKCAFCASEQNEVA